MRTAMRGILRAVARSPVRLRSSARESIVSTQRISLSWLCLLLGECHHHRLSNHAVRPRQHVRRNPIHFGFVILDFGLFGQRITRPALANTFGGITGILYFRFWIFDWPVIG